MKPPDTLQQVRDILVLQNFVNIFALDIYFKETLLLLVPHFLVVTDINKKGNISAAHFMTEGINEASQQQKSLSINDNNNKTKTKLAMLPFT